jgi:hypothetical protein
LHSQLRVWRQKSADMQPLFHGAIALCLTRGDTCSGIALSIPLVLSGSAKPGSEILVATRSFRFGLPKSHSQHRREKAPTHQPNRIFAPRRIVLPGYFSRAAARTHRVAEPTPPIIGALVVWIFSSRTIANCPHSSYADFDSLYLEAIHNLASLRRTHSSSRD